MSNALIIAGTGTDVGKTVFAAALVTRLDAAYWKPIQAGLESETDSQIVARLSGADPSRILPEAYRLKTPASPHYAAERDGIEIDANKLKLPQTSRPLVVELAGGLLVPISRRMLQIDLVASWRAPVILCAETRLGTINHTLLSVEALKDRRIPILGIAFIGAPNDDSENTICAFARVQRFGRLPHIDPLTPAALHQAFAANFDTAALLGLSVGGP